jgi:hypothetical protein
MNEVIQTGSPQRAAGGSARGLFIDGGRLLELARSSRDRYASAEPFPHVLFDDFLPPDVLDRVLEEFPGPGDTEWITFDHVSSKKLALSDETRMGPVTRQLLYELNAAGFMTFLEELTGIDGLIPDPHFVGGGLHQIVRGGLLGIHADFNLHKKLRLDRRLNALIFLNKDWKEEWGGAIELWDRGMTRCVRKYDPIFNRCVIFTTTDFSYHGHPDPLNCPPERTRRSLALYYYTNGRPAHEVSEPHSTLHYSRPGEGPVRRHRKPRRRPLKTFMLRLLPPILYDGYRALRYGKDDPRRRPPVHDY